MARAPEPTFPRPTMPILTSSMIDSLWHSDGERLAANIFRHRIGVRSFGETLIAGRATVSRALSMDALFMGTCLLARVVCGRGLVVERSRRWKCERSLKKSKEFRQAVRSANLWGCARVPKGRGDFTMKKAAMTTLVLCVVSQTARAGDINGKWISEMQVGDADGKTYTHV